MIKEAYDRLTSSREGFLEQARSQSEITIPSLIPPDGQSEDFSHLYQPYQSVGAFGVNALSNKLTGALYPPTEPFFKLVIKPGTDEEKALTSDQLNELDMKMSEIEQLIIGQFAKRGDRAAITETMKHLVVGGNALLHIGEERSRTYSLDRYVAVRDGNGSLLKVITKDVFSYETFKESHPELESIHEAHRGNRAYDPKSIEVYTEMCRLDNKWVVREEAAGKLIGKSLRSYPLDKPPYIALRYNRIDGQSYGRGYVENLFGDLRSLESLSKSLVEGAAISARIVHLVDPNGFLGIEAFERALNGDVLPGQPGNVSTVGVDKSPDLAVAANEVARIEARLNQAFMLAAAGQRDAERVTATEIRSLAAEVEQVLGGAYAILAEEFQRPFIMRLMDVLQKDGLIPEFKEGLIDVSIVTGVSAIGRGIDRDRLTQFFTALYNTFGAELIAKYINVPGAIAKLSASFGISLVGLIKTPEEIAQEEQLAQQAALAQTLGPSAIQAAGKVTQTQLQGDLNNASTETPS